MFEHLKEGDQVTRNLGGIVDMPMTVITNTDGVIKAKADKCPWPDTFWEFDAVTGAEIDHDLGWGPEYGVTGSRLVL